MLYPQYLITELTQRQAELTRFERSWREDVAVGAKLLAELGKMPSDHLLNTLRQQRKAFGAVPSAEFDAFGSLAIPFREKWLSHEESRRWAARVLTERTTFAADGSQMLMGRELSVPLGAVQVAGFENPHRADGQGYRKQATFRLVTPEELLQAESDDLSPNEIVNYRRFMLEIEALGDFITRHAGWEARGERLPLAFFDGTLLISYAVERTSRQKDYTKATADLVRLSQEKRVPLVGYIDQSLARDYISLLDTFHALIRTPDYTPLRRTLYDAQLLRPTPDDSDALLHGWGMRTAFCYCDRAGLRDDFSVPSPHDIGRDDHLVGFVYLQTTGQSTPARLDVPAWIYEADLLDEVVQIVQAECVVGSGYPYALETADAAALLTNRDQEPFLRAVHNFLPIQRSHKALSKGRRR